MDEIGKIIFNSLVSRRSVWLPCIGTFGIETVPARDNSDGTVTPPENRLLFMEGHPEGAVPVTDMIDPGPEGQSPSSVYDLWLAKATERGPVVIEGIGVVNNGVFTPYESLVRAINPIVVTKSAAVRPARNKKGLSRNEKTGLALIAIFIIVLAVGWTLWNKHYNSPSGHNKWNTHNPAATDNYDEIPEATVTVEDQSEEGPTVIEITEPDISAAAPASSAVAPSAGGFYVVGGVFSIPENADKYIREMKAKYPDLDYHKHPYPGNTTMVSLGGSSDRNEANRERRRIENVISEYDLWLYEVK